MQDKLLKKILPDFAGPEAEKLVDLLFGKQNVNEFLIAKKLNMTINQTRNMLYKLADSGLVQFVRKKDKKKGGWYTYFWTLKVKRSLQTYQEKIQTEIAGLQKHIDTLEKERHYYCVNCDLTFNEEQALLGEYTCPECGEILTVKMTSDITNHMRQEIKKLQGTLEQLNIEIQNIEDKELKSKEKRIKAEQKTKEEERKKKREERQKEKLKEKKKAEKESKEKGHKPAAKKPEKKKPAKKKTVKKSSKKK